MNQRSRAIKLKSDDQQHSSSSDSGYQSPKNADGKLFNDRASFKGDIRATLSNFETNELIDRNLLLGLLPNGDIQIQKAPSLSAKRTRRV